MVSFQAIAFLLLVLAPLRFAEAALPCECLALYKPSGYGARCASWDAPDEKPWCAVATATACGEDATFESTTGLFWAHRPCADMAPRLPKPADRVMQPSVIAAGGPRAEGAPRVVEAVAVARVMHVVFVSDVDPHLAEARTTGILETWGARAAHLIFVAIAHKDTKTGEVVRAHWRSVAGERIITPPEALGADRSAQCAWAMRHVFDNWANLSGGSEIGWIAFSNDNVFWLEENLAAYLATQGTQPASLQTEPLFLGHALKEASGITFNSGALFVLSVSALRLLLEELDPHSHSDCTARGLSFDLLVAECLRPHGVRPVDTRDVVGGERFNAFGPTVSARGETHSWYSDYSRAATGVALQKGAACCAADAVAFHYVEKAEALALDALLHRRPPFEKAASMTPAQLTELWPKDWNVIGGYSAQVDPSKDAPDGVWDLLVRKIKLGGTSSRSLLNG